MPGSDKAGGICLKLEDMSEVTVSFADADKK